MPSLFSRTFCSQQMQLPQSLWITENRKFIVCAVQCLDGYHKHNLWRRQNDQCLIEATAGSQRTEHSIFFRNYTRMHCDRFTKWQTIAGCAFVCHTKSITTQQVEQMRWKLKKEKSVSDKIHSISNAINYIPVQRMHEMCDGTNMRRHWLLISIFSANVEWSCVALMVVSIVLEEIHISPNVLCLSFPLPQSPDGAVKWRRLRAHDEIEIQEQARAISGRATTMRCMADECAHARQTSIANSWS